MPGFSSRQELRYVWAAPQRLQGALPCAGVAHAERARPPLVPAFDVTEHETCYILRADVPGVRADDIAIAVTGDRVTIRGQRSVSPDQAGARRIASERRHGAFSRTFVLPGRALAEAVVTELRDGVLTVVVPRAATRPARGSSARAPGAR